MKNLAVLVVVVFLAACSPKINGTSEQAFEESTQEIMKSMSAEEMQKFKSDLRKASQHLVQAHMKERNINPIAASVLIINDPAAMTAIVIQGLHGKTASDVKALGDKLDQSRN